jgi:hypothetical protein
MNARLVGLVVVLVTATVGLGLLTPPRALAHHGGDGFGLGLGVGLLGGLILDSRPVYVYPPYPCYGYSFYPYPCYPYPDVVYPDTYPYRYRSYSYPERDDSRYYDRRDRDHERWGRGGGDRR